MAQRGEDGNPAHVRFAEDEDEEITALPPRRTVRTRARGTRPRRGTYDSIDSAADERRPSRQERDDENSLEGAVRWRRGRRRSGSDEFEGIGPRDEAGPAATQRLGYSESPTRYSEGDDSDAYDDEDEESDDRIGRPIQPNRQGTDESRRTRLTSDADARRTVSGTRSPPTAFSERIPGVSPYFEPGDRNLGPSSRFPPLNDAGDDEELLENFQFITPLQSLAESSRDGDSDTETPEPEDRTSLKDERGKLKTLSPTVVKTSYYTGNAELSGSHTAALTAVHGSSDQSLFRWLHVRQEVMNFDDLWMEISRLSDLSNVEKGAIARLRADAKNSLKSRYNPKGMKVGYAEPRVIEIPLKSFHKKMENDSTLGSARWICIPYFSLEEYSGLLSASNLSLFPAQTLLQAQYSRSSMQRDMEQAVCQLGHAKRGEVFHIAQLWCVVIDNCLLVTCGTMGQADLQGDALKVNAEPSRDLMTRNEGKILVSYGKSVTWVFTTEECQTWFAFISKFQAFWPKTLEFWHRDRLVGAGGWHKILHLASRSRHNVRIIMKIGNLPTPPTRAILCPEPQGVTQSQDGSTGSGLDTDLHVMTLPQAALKPSSSTSRISDLKLHLESAHEFLSSNTSYLGRKMYKVCLSSTRKECYDFLQQFPESAERDGPRTEQVMYEASIDIFNAADILYKFFLPVDCDDPTSGKFWGAVRALVNSSYSNYNGGISDNSQFRIREELRDFTAKLIAFQNIMSHASKEERAALEMPQEFVTAWLYAVMFMVTAVDNGQHCYKCMGRMKQLVEKGMGKLMHWLPDKSLLERTGVMPLEVMSLMTLNLLQDQVRKSDDICETYSQYLNYLGESIASKPSDRSYQNRLNLVQQEMVAIRRTLWTQRTIVSNIRGSLTATSVEGGEETATRRHRPMLNPRRGGNYAEPRRGDYGERDFPEPRRVGYYAESRHEGADAPYLRPDYGASRPNDLHAASVYAPGQYYAASRPGGMDVVTVRPGDEDMDFDGNFAQEISGASKLPSTDAGGLRGLFFLECSRLVDQREYEFRQYAKYAVDLQQALTYKMDFTKDRQENAIFAFTLVTIIFLPISTVSSIFGMNTTDVRDMESGQWLYWAVAIPLTLFVILMGLWWMGEMGNIARWLTRKPLQWSQGSYGVPPGPMAPQAAGEEYFASTPAGPGGGGVKYGYPAHAATAQQMVDFDGASQVGGLGPPGSYGYARRRSVARY